jgi:hypothetical protein
MENCSVVTRDGTANSNNRNAAGGGGRRGGSQEDSVTIKRDGYTTRSGFMKHDIPAATIPMRNVW